MWSFSLHSFLIPGKLVIHGVYYPGTYLFNRGIETVLSKDTTQPLAGVECGLVCLKSSALAIRLLQLPTNIQTLIYKTLNSCQENAINEEQDMDDKQVPDSSMTEVWSASSC